MAAAGSAEAQLTLDASSPQFSAGGAAPSISQFTQTTDITLNASRTVIGWSSYNLTSNQTVIYRFPDRGSIVLNKISGPATIDGQVEALVGSQRGGGNVWFQAPGGIVFGPNAQVTVGGLLATPATVSAAFLDPSNFSFDFTGAGAAPITVRAGSQIKATSGALALVAANITTEAGSTVSSGSGASVLYGAANDFTIRFAAQSAGDLDLVDFVVPATGGTGSATPLTLQGQTVGGSVFLAVVNRGDVASAVINAPGLIAAQSATADHGDVVLTSGVGIVARQPGSGAGNTTTTTKLTLDIIAAQRDLLGGFTQPTTLTANQLAAGRDLGLLALNLNVGALNAGRNLAVNASQAITLGASTSVGGGAAFRTTGAFTVGSTGTGTVTSAGALQVDAGTVQAGALNAGRSMAVNASGAGANGGPAVNLATVLAGDDISINSTNAAGSIVLGRASITGAGPDTAPAGRNLSLNASGASADVTYGGATGATLNGVTGVALSAGRDVTANVNGVLTLTQGSAGRTFTVRAQDLNITGPLKTADLRVESLLGGFTLGGGGGGRTPSGAAAAGGPPGLTLSDAEFQMISATGQVSLYAGSSLGGAKGDFTVLDLAIDPSKLAHLLLAAGANNDVNVTGVIAPTVSGGSLTIGESAGGSPWDPGRILVSGSVGFANGSFEAGYTNVRAFHDVGLFAGQDIILGSTSFIGLVANVAPGQIDLAHDKPAGVLALAADGGHIFLTADVLSLAADARIVQENTGAIAHPNGLLLVNHTVDPVATVLTTTRAQVVDLFGILADRNGVLRSGAAAGVGVSVTGGSGGGGDVRVGGFSTDLTSPTGSGAVAAATAQTSAQVLTTPAASADNPTKDQEAAAAGGAVAIKPAPLMTIAQPALDAVVSDPVELGSGSEEVWRRKHPRQAKP